MPNSGRGLSGAKRRIVERLKRADTASAPEMAAEFGLTDTAVRQHLEHLEARGLVERTALPASGRGRPPVRWRLTPAAEAHFADRHADLSVELIDGIRESLGDAALRSVLDRRAAQQVAAYAVELQPARDLASRVARLAELRTAEGFLSEAVVDQQSIVLLEHHCPISDAAMRCQHLCESELALFRSSLGPSVTVEREQHMLGGDQRCAYRITPA